MALQLFLLRGDAIGTPKGTAAKPAASTDLSPVRNKMSGLFILKKSANDVIPRPMDLANPHGVSEEIKCSILASGIQPSRITSFSVNQTQGERCMPERMIETSTSRDL